MGIGYRSVAIIFDGTDFDLLPPHDSQKTIDAGRLWAMKGRILNGEGKSPNKAVLVRGRV